MNLILMSKSEFSLSTEGCQISDHQKIFKSSQFKKAKITDFGQKVVVYWGY